MLSTHRYDVHKGRIFTCDLCGDRLTTHRHKYDHSKREHPGAVVTFTTSYGDGDANGVTKDANGVGKDAKGDANAFANGKRMSSSDPEVAAQRTKLSSTTTGAVTTDVSAERKSETKSDSKPVKLRAGHESTQGSLKRVDLTSVLMRQRKSVSAPLRTRIALEKKYRCRKCLISYSQRSHLNAHHRDVHLGRIFTCKGCHKQINNRDRMYFHKRKCGHEMTVRYVGERARGRGLVREHEDSLSLQAELPDSTEPYHIDDIDGIAGEIMVPDDAIIDSTLSTANIDTSLEKTTKKLKHIRKYESSVRNCLPKNYHCRKCGQKFSQRRHAIAHFKDVHLGRIFTCKGCHEEIDNQGRMHHHERKCGHEMTVSYVMESGRALDSKLDDSLSLQTELKDSTESTKPYILIDDASAVVANEVVKDSTFITDDGVSTKKMKTVRKIPKYQSSVRNCQVKNYRCRECGQMFSQVCKLKDHQQDKHKGRVYTCNGCLMELRSRESMNKHKRICGYAMTVGYTIEDPHDVVSAKTASNNIKSHDSVIDIVTVGTSTYGLKPLKIVLKRLDLKTLQIHTKKSECVSPQVGTTPFISPGGVDNYERNILMMKSNDKCQGDETRDSADGEAEAMLSNDDLSSGNDYSSAEDDHAASEKKHTADESDQEGNDTDSTLSAYEADHMTEKEHAVAEADYAATQRDPTVSKADHAAVGDAYCAAADMRDEGESDDGDDNDQVDPTDQWIRQTKPKPPKTKILLHCRYCYRKFNTHATLSEHVMTVHRARFFTCNVCGKQMESRSHKYRHRKVHPGRVTFTASYRKNLPRRLNSIAGNESLPSFKAGKIRAPFDLDQSDERKNQRLCRDSMCKVNGKQFDCTECGQSFSQRCRVYDHFQDVHLGRVFTCNGCHKKIPRKDKIYEHRKKCKCDFTITYDIEKDSDDGSDVKPMNNANHQMIPERPNDKPRFNCGYCH